MLIDTLAQTELAPFIDYFYKWEREKANQVYLRQPVGDTYVDYTWAEVGQQARRMATYLRSLDLPAHSHIGLISRNCPHWLIADIAILISGHVSVPFYPTLTPDQLHRVLDHSRCAVLFVGKIDNWNKLKTAVPDTVVSIGFPDCQASPTLQAWREIMEAYPPMAGSPALSLDDLFTVVYTSGTTGTPKGVMVDYRAAAHLARAAQPLMFQKPSHTRFFSYLPLCHVAERSLVEGIGLVTGGTVYFFESLATFSKNLANARPTHFLAVPRIWTKFQEGILAGISERKLTRLLRIPIVARLLKRRIRQTLGLDDAVLIMTGAAPTPVSLIQWFRRLDIRIQESYGMTETLAYVSIMPVDQIKDGSVGRVNPGMRVRIDPSTSEVLTKSDWTMRGYYRNPTLTAETLTDDKWLRTGDIGELDSDGFLQILGRVSDVYKSVKGEFIAPIRLELGFCDNLFIDQICVMGRQLPQPIALIVLSEAAQKVKQSEVTESLTATLNAVNEQVYPYERIKKMVILGEHWTVENNLMTSTLKIRRNEIERRFIPFMASWYEQAESIVWVDDRQ